MKKYFAALRRAQQDIDLRPELYTHYYKNEFPAASTSRWTPAAGARASGSCSSPIQEEIFEESQEWIAERDIFDGDLGSRDYEHSILSIAAE